MEVNRREFIQATAAASATTLLAKLAAAQDAAAATQGEVVNVAMIGTGVQGRVLLEDTLNIPGIQFKALCDIWESFSLRYAKGKLRQAKQTVNTYSDYREMLEKEKDLHAVIVATPDFMHAEHTIACLKAGLHVYCEKEMSNTIEASKQMVLAARETGNLLQVGHQRRSNPMYLNVLELIQKDGLCGRLTNLFAQWARPAQPLTPTPENLVIPAETLKKFGYDTMDQFRNWRWFKKYSSGPIADLGSHQIDIFSWFLGAEPSGLMAMGGKDYYKDRDWYEDVLCLYDYKAKQGSARAFYQVLNTTGYGDFYERFSGDKGTVIMSENPRACYFAPEGEQPLPEWLGSVERVKFAGKPIIPLFEAFQKKSETCKKDMEIIDQTHTHQLHLQNFFTAVRAKDKKLLTCPGEVAYATAVAVLNVIPAVEAAKRLDLKDEDYKV